MISPRPAVGQPADSLYPLTVGRATLAACRAAYDRWSTRADADLTFYLDAALAALATGFDPAGIRASALMLSEDISRPARSGPNRAVAVRQYEHD